MQWQTTTTLIEGMETSGRDPAWDRFVGHFRGPLIQLARNMGLAQLDAEDVTQETLTTFAMAFRQGRYKRGEGRLSKWLYGIAVRRIRYARKRLAQRELLMRSPRAKSRGVVSVQKSGWEALHRAWELAVLEACQERVRSEVRPIVFRAFEMVVHGGASPTQAAETLGMSVKWVYNTKHRVLKRICDVRSHVVAELARKSRHGVS